MYKFLVEEKEFFLNDNFEKETNFTVKSSPWNYDVIVKNDKDISEEIQLIMDKNPNNLMLIDKKVYDLYFQEVNIAKDRIYFAEATEQFKTISGVLDVVAFLEKKDFTKAETLVVIGGGIIEDVGAFTGACFKRGIKWIYFPTTLLSMCDSCIGGKTGINHNNTKNQLALFSAPQKVIININFLKTLSDFDIKSGMGEILKLLITGGKVPLSVYENEVVCGKVKNFESYKYLILSSLAVKKAIIEEDEFEKNLRRSLNYGHTLGHAIESLSDYKIPHGQAVIIGMVIVNKIALNRGILNQKDYDLCKQLSIELLGSSVIKDVSLDGIDKLLKRDKKTLGNKVTFVVINSIGSTKFCGIDISDELIDEIKTITEQEF